MNIKPTHTFLTKCNNLQELFDCRTLRQFMSKLEKFSLLDVNRYDSNKYKGDGFELFIELLLLLHPNDTRLGIGEYEPVMVEDNGVDGLGVNIWGNKSVVQIKYRSNSKTLLTANKDHLSNLFSDGMLQHQVVTGEDLKEYRHYVFTTAEGLHFYTDKEMYKSRVKCIGYKELRQLVDNNWLFWSGIKQLINED